MDELAYQLFKKVITDRLVDTWLLGLTMMVRRDYSSGTNS